MHELVGPSAMQCQSLQGQEAGISSGSHLSCGMHDSGESSLHLREIFRCQGIFDESARSNDFMIVSMIRFHRIIVPFQSSPGLVGHGSIKGFAELETDLFCNAFCFSQGLKCWQMGHFMPDQLHSTICPKPFPPWQIARIGMWSQLATVPASGTAADVSCFQEDHLGLRSLILCRLLLSVTARKTRGGRTHLVYPVCCRSTGIPTSDDHDVGLLREAVARTEVPERRFGGFNLAFVNSVVSRCGPCYCDLPSKTWWDWRLGEPC